MSGPLPDSSQFALFKDTLARRLIAQPGFQDDSDSDQDAASALDDFTSYLASEVWPFLPTPLREATFESRETIPLLDADSLTLHNIPTSFTDSLLSCGLADDTDGALAILRRVLEAYVGDAIAPPPMWSRTRTAACELCEREVPLTYHHLIPRETHDKARKKGWHPEHMLNAVAWLCRPCHSAVHHVASNEELARQFYTLDLLLEREDIQRWRKYAAKQRWGIRRG